MYHQSEKTIIASSLLSRCKIDANLSITATKHAEEYRMLCRSLGKEKTTPEMQWSSTDEVDHEHLVLFDDDIPVATISWKAWDSSGDFSAFLQRLYGEIYADGKAVLAPTPPPPVFSEIRGRVCYVGEFFIRREYRRTISIGDLALFAYVRAQETVNPDWFWGFVREKHALLGLSIRYYGARCYPKALTWKRSNDYHMDSDRFVCSSRAEIEWALHHCT